MSHAPADGGPRTPSEKIEGVPDFGWRVKLSYECQDKMSPFFKPRLSQIPQYLGLSMRYSVMWAKKKKQGKKPFIDHLNPLPHNPIYGCPIGGIGCGTIGRGYRGEFCRFQMIPGIYRHNTVDANQFIVCIRRNNETIYQQVLSSQVKKGKSLKSWSWGFPGGMATYHALYPRAWTVYNIKKHNVRLICRQISPIYPHEYQETCLPTAVFVWTIENNSPDELDVSITFTFQNGQGSKEDSNKGVTSEVFNVGEVTGVSIKQTFRSMDCTYGISASAKDGVDISTAVNFDPHGTGEDLWCDLHEDGKLGNTPVAPPGGDKGKDIGAAVCASCTVQPSSSQSLDFSLVWDMPIIQFGAKEQYYARRYTRWFGTEGKAAPNLCKHALNRYPVWEKEIIKWQDPILNASKLPSWYKSALFNELYFVSDGGTVWLDPYETDKDFKADISLHPYVKDIGRFGYLEGMEYRMYNTYDVHHYASFSLIMLWPKLQLSLQYDYAATIVKNDDTCMKYLMHGAKGPTHVANTVPHDMGDPEDEPWKRVNCYTVHPTHDWKDLNMKFVLQVYRDYIALTDRKYLEEMYPVALGVMEHSLDWDTDGDGIIDNSGYADQTYDAWTMQGASAYCGGLWLAALRMLCEMAFILGKTEDVDKFAAILKLGAKSYQDKLWTGKYYQYDSSNSGHHDSIMADQLSGQWFLHASEIVDEAVFPADKVRTALKTVFDNNVMKYANGTMGAINGTKPDGSRDTSSPQSEEFWTGITYGLAASMIQEGMLDEGFQTAWGAYHACWEGLGLQFQTPEAYTSTKGYRSLGYMRPLSVWAIQWAIERFQRQLLVN
ncbi:non-lysosomal glucosylceramidase isoform X1 [Patella vulgata]|uniref:non-lysosomal glucosylceramidase isoform X1 n=1 Tax=Patella vulgata TaxID=6465 RepID=UPI00217F9344|nr:non-lysosomal glucosylceramidase isoform X1 [Patella vulgata]